MLEQSSKPTRSILCLSPADCPAQSTESHVQGWRLHHCPVQCLTMLSTKKFLLISNLNCSLCSLRPFPLILSSCHCPRLLQGHCQGWGRHNLWGEHWCQLSSCLSIRCENRLKTSSFSRAFQSVSPGPQDYSLSYGFLKISFFVWQLTKP